MIKKSKVTSVNLESLNNPYKTILMAQDKDQKTLNVPPLRFPGFTDEWKTDRLSSYAKKIIRKNKGNSITNVLCNSANLGIIPQLEYFDRDIANSENTNAYYVIERGDFVYNPRKSVSAPYGPVNLYDRPESGIISPLYLCFRVKNISKDFLLRWFKGNSWHQYVYSHGDTGVRYDRVSIKDEIFLNMPILLPSIPEQEKIAKFLSLLDERITTQNKIIEDLKKLKSAIIDSHFDGQKVNRRIGDLIHEVSNRNKSNTDLPVLSVSNRQGFIAQSEQFENRVIASDDTSNYKIVIKDDFAYNPARINVRSIARLVNYESGIVSPMYLCFRCSNEILPEYLELFFQSRNFQLEVEKKLEGSVRLCLSMDGMKSIQFSLPPIYEQKALTKRLKAIQSKLSNEETLNLLYQAQRRYLLTNLFI